MPRIHRLTFLLLGGILLLQAGCASAPTGTEANLAGQYAVTFQGLYSGSGSLFIRITEDGCDGTVTLPSPSPGGEVVRCSASRGQLRLVIRPFDSAGQEIVVTAKLEGTELAGTWGTGGRRGRFVGRKRGF